MDRLLAVQWAPPAVKGLGRRPLPLGRRAQVGRDRLLDHTAIGAVAHGCVGVAAVEAAGQADAALVVVAVGHCGGLGVARARWRRRTADPHDPPLRIPQKLDALLGVAGAHRHQAGVAHQPLLAIAEADRLQLAVAVEAVAAAIGAAQRPALGNPGQTAGLVIQPLPLALQAHRLVAVGLQGLQAPALVGAEPRSQRDRCRRSGPQGFLPGAEAEPQRRQRRIGPRQIGRDLQPHHGPLPPGLRCPQRADRGLIGAQPRLQQRQAPVAEILGAARLLSQAAAQGHPVGSQLEQAIAHQRLVQPLVAAVHQHGGADLLAAAAQIPGPQPQLIRPIGQRRRIQRGQIQRAGHGVAAAARLRQRDPRPRRRSIPQRRQGQLPAQQLPLLDLGPQLGGGADRDRRGLGLGAAQLRRPGQPRRAQILGIAHPQALRLDRLEAIGVHRRDPQLHQARGAGGELEATQVIERHRRPGGGGSAALAQLRPQLAHRAEARGPHRGHHRLPRQHRRAGGEVHEDLGCVGAGLRHHPQGEALGARLLAVAHRGQDHPIAHLARARGP